MLISTSGGAWHPPVVVATSKCISFAGRQDDTMLNSHIRSWMMIGILIGPLLGCSFVDLPGNLSYVAASEALDRREYVEAFEIYSSLKSRGGFHDITSVNDSHTYVKFASDTLPTAIRSAATLQVTELKGDLMADQRVWGTQP